MMTAGLTIVSPKIETCSTEPSTDITYMVKRTFWQKDQCNLVKCKVV